MRTSTTNSPGGRGNGSPETFTAQVTILYLLALKLAQVRKTLPEAEMRHVRGPSMAMIFQNPSSHLDPVMTIGRQIAEASRHHLGISRAEGRELAVDLMATVVCRVKPSVHAAYQAQDHIPVNVTAVYARLARVPTTAGRELVRHTAQRLGPVIRA